MSSDVKIKKRNVYNRSKKVVVFYNRIIIFSMLILFCISLSAIFLYKSFAVDSQKKVSYQEKSNVDYRVFLKKNSFYEKPYLGKNMAYVASLINTIDVYFDYIFVVDEPSDIEFEYNAVGTLIISDRTGKKNYFEKKYNLIKNTTDKVSNSKNYALNKRISIDYDHYNSLANRFKSSYGVDSISNLEVKLNIHQKGSEDNDYNLDNNSEMSILIPLSEQSVNIKLNYKEVNDKSKVVKKQSLGKKNYTYMLFGVIFAIIATISIVVLIKILFIIKSKKSEYDKFISKVLKEYDRLIVETTTPPIVKRKNLIEVGEFNELLDVRDNLNLPIKYYIVSKHKESYFYIDHEDEVYILIIDAERLEEDNKRND